MTTPTKALVLGAVLGCSLFALPAAAQTAAATLPDAFGQPAAAAPATRAAPPAPVSAEAPDIARAEQALRAVIASLQSRQIDYSVFSPNLAEQIRSRAAEFAPRIQQLGAVRTVEHRGQQDGADLFRVVFEKQATDWVIGFDDEDQIAALLYRPAPG
ncbi:hypothetical protein [Brevundimonas sp.]|uniref:hypothetical protein n=1 Tax=Brevundimonas sp. TaxID=1871086 RepID=UPI0028AA95AE|nr:hypothetical protein [Brevundimonas sp.]